MAAKRPKTMDIVDLDTYVAKPLSTKGTTKSTAISVELYSELLRPGFPEFIDLSELDDDSDVVILQTPKRRRSSPYFEKGESSSAAALKSDDFLCNICYEHKAAGEGFPVSECKAHVYCKDCMALYVASKLQENITRIPCPAPDCPHSLEAEHFAAILPVEVYDRWCSALCEAAILGSEKAYCPFKDCSALLINDGAGGGDAGITEAECPNCWRLFCARCKVPWHSGIGCQDFQKLNKDEREKEDIMLMNLAKEKRWRRCPQCGIFVEKIVGCEFMTCRCRTCFCYDCGTIKQRTGHHFCTCKRRF